MTSALLTRLELLTYQGTTIHGTAAGVLQQAKDCESGLFGTLEQDKRFRIQMAAFQAELSTIKFD